MPTAKAYASTILAKFEQAQTKLVGKAVILTDGKAGTMESEFPSKVTKASGLVSTIKLAQS